MTTATHILTYMMTILLGTLGYEVWGSYHHRGDGLSPDGLIVGGVLLSLPIVGLALLIAWESAVATWRRRGPRPRPLRDEAGYALEEGLVVGLAVSLLPTIVVLARWYGAGALPQIWHLVVAMLSLPFGLWFGAVGWPAITDALHERRRRRGIPPVD